MDAAAKASRDLTEGRLHTLASAVGQKGHPARMRSLAVGLAMRDQMHVGYLGEGVLKEVVRIGRIRIDLGSGRQVQGERPKGGDVPHRGGSQDQLDRPAGA